MKGAAALASSAKQKTTFAKLNRESKLRERRRENEVRRQARSRPDSSPSGDS
jgi:hypothetical protein